MTEKEACQILGISQKAELCEIKKRYRQLITQVHPDISIPSKNGCAYNAQEINAAYSILKKRKNAEKENASPSRKQRSGKHQKHPAWNAPVNENAYIEREILHYAEDYDGSVLGNFCIARGKYLWTTEEDFPLFLLSIHKCAKQLLDEADASLPPKTPSTIRHQLQAELAYLLAQQFTDSTVLLAELAKEEPPAADGSRTFYLPAMLELSIPKLRPSADELLYPSGIRQHKLYIKNHSSQELGYLSFPDDRLYYVAVPLFEQKTAQVRIQAAKPQKRNNRMAAAKYQPLHLWLKLPGTTENAMPESLNLQIAQLLERYKALI